MSEISLYLEDVSEIGRDLRLAPYQRLGAHGAGMVTCFPFCISLVFFVTLEEIAGFLYIKAVWEIEDFLGYELATVLNSTFCYKLHQRTPDNEPSAVL